MAGKTEYKNNWQKENVDRVNLTMAKGRKEAIRAHAEAHGESVNSFINRAISETMERDGLGGPTGAAEAGGIPTTLKRVKPARGHTEGRRAGIRKRS